MLELAPNLDWWDLGLLGCGRRGGGGGREMKWNDLKAKLYVFSEFFVFTFGFSGSSKWVLYEIESNKKGLNARAK